MRMKSILVPVMVAIVMITSSTLAQTLHNITDLGAGYAWGINNAGQVVGSFGLWENDTITLFGGTGKAINDSGQVVVSSAGSSFLWEDGVTTTIGGYANGINDAGQVVGRDGFSAWRWDKTNGKMYLGDGMNDAYGINSFGQIAGMVRNVNNLLVPAVWNGSGNVVDLGTFGGYVDDPSAVNGCAESINELSQVVGFTRNAANDNYHAFYWDNSNGLLDLGTLNNNFGGSYALSINETGQVVGFSSTSSGQEHAFFWDSAQGMVDLNNFLPLSSGWDYLRIARGINDNGQIVGEGYIDGQAHGFLLTPIPESAKPPVADADGPYSIYVGDVLTLDASGSTDADDDIVSYMWDLDDDENFETDAGGEAVFDVNYADLQSLGLLVDHTYNIHLKVTDSQGQSDVADSTLIIVPKPATVVAVDIKPGSCPNPVNVKSSGVLPIAILGTEDVNVITIDPTSIRLAGVEPLRSGYEDVAAPVLDSNDCNCITEGPDGLLDLTLKFETQRIVEAVGDVNDGDVRVLTLTGVLFDPMPFETPIEGADCILIRGRHKPINPADINKDGVVNAADFAIIAENWLQSTIVDD